MKKLAVLLPAVLLGLAAFADARDSDEVLLEPGYRKQVIKDPNAPLYFRPTQRYYGAGYTISYRYVPVSSQDSYGLTAGGATNFRTEAFRMATEDIPAWGTNSPRLTVRDPKSAAPRSAVTSIVRKKTTTRSTTTTSPTDAAPVETTSPAPVPAEAPKP